MLFKKNIYHHKKTMTSTNKNVTQTTQKTKIKYVTCNISHALWELCCYIQNITVEYGTHILW